MKVCRHWPQVFFGGLPGTVSSRHPRVLPPVRACDSRTDTPVLSWRHLAVAASAPNVPPTPRHRRTGNALSSATIFIMPAQGSSRSPACQPVSGLPSYGLDCATHPFGDARRSWRDMPGEIFMKFAPFAHTTAPKAHTTVRWTAARAAASATPSFPAGAACTSRLTSTIAALRSRTSGLAGAGTNTFTAPLTAARQTALAAAIDTLAADPVLRGKLGWRGRTQAEEKHSWAGAVDRILGLAGRADG